jgi:prepilin-type N-terminal cleavage/methylation domain-containing protein
MNKKGLSLLEIIVSIIIFSLVALGLANVFVAGKRYIQHNRLRMGGGELGKYFFDPIQNSVRQDIWSTTSPLGTGDNSTLDSCVMVGTSAYSVTYNIQTDYLSHSTNSQQPYLVKVKSQINWQE